jgi:hypothetical protein
MSGRIGGSAGPAIQRVDNLGAIITGPKGDLNLDINTYVNGSPMNPIQLDTSAAPQTSSTTSSLTDPA